MTTMWGDCPKADIMDAWCEALSGIDPEHIRMGLGGVMTAHPDWPPTLGEFLALCRPPPTPAAHRPYLPAPIAKRGPIDPKVQEQIAKLTPKVHKRHPKDWAREILAKHENGERLLPIQVEFAREALGIKT